MSPNAVKAVLPLKERT